MSHKKIPSIGPSITQKEIDLVTEAVTHGWYENMNLHMDQFLIEFSSFIGKEYCFPTSHGTAAIHLTLLALGIGPGDEVIVPDITWVASACPVVYIGATPVFVDMDPHTWCISAESFERAITPQTKAVMVVDLFGNMPDMEAIRQIAEHHHIHIIEDAAEGIGAEYDYKPAGSLGDTGIFSFNATKLVIAGQGGMVVTNDKTIYERCRTLGHHGIDKSPEARYYWSNEIGYNYNWSNIQAALALAQLRRIDELVNKRRQIFGWYQERLKEIEGLTLNSESPRVKNTYWITTVMLNSTYGMDKEALNEAFRAYNVDARPFFYPITSMPPYVQYTMGQDMSLLNPVSYQMSPFGLCLPSGANLSEDDVDYVCDCFKKILTNR